MSYKIIDGHSHIYPEKIAQKATNSISTFYGIAMAEQTGSSDLLLKEEKEAGVERVLICSVATTKHQVRAINSFIYEETQKHPEYIGFMTLHPSMTKEEIVEEINWCKQRNFKGIKLHPDFQQFAIDSDMAQPIYEAAQGVFPILFHTGDKRYNFSHPLQLVNVATKYPKLICIAAHFGGFSEWEKIKVYKGLENVYFDTSSSLSFMTPQDATKLIKFFGAEWFIFGVDFPMWNPTKELELFMKLELTENERKMILSENISRLLKL